MWLSVALISVLCSADLKGQTSPHFSQSIWQQALLNPAAVGSHPWLEINGIVRGQWIGIEGIPITQGLSIDLPIPIFRTGVGLAVVNEELGAFRRTEAKVSGSYQLLRKRGNLSIGAQFGLRQTRLDGSQLVTPDGVYGETVSHEDDLLILETTNIVSPLLSLGLYYRNKQWEAGLYLQDLLSGSVSLGLNGTVIAKERIAYNLYLNRSLEIGNNWKITPSIWVKTDRTNLQTTFGALIGHKTSIQGGIFLRGYNNTSLDALIAMLAYNVRKELRVAYAYDFSLSNLRNFTRQTHELSLSYQISSLFLGKRSKIIYNPRFL